MNLQVENLVLLMDPQGMLMRGGYRKSMKKLITKITKKVRKKMILECPC